MSWHTLYIYIICILYNYKLTCFEAWFRSKVPFTPWISSPHRQDFQVERYIYCNTVVYIYIIFIYIDAALALCVNIYKCIHIYIYMWECKGFAATSSALGRCNRVPDRMQLQQPDRIPESMLSHAVSQLTDSRLVSVRCIIENRLHWRVALGVHFVSDRDHQCTR